MKKEHKTLRTAKKIFNTSKALRSFRLQPCPPGPWCPHERKEAIGRAIVRLVERLKHNSALVNTYFHFEE